MRAWMLFLLLVAACKEPEVPEDGEPPAPDPVEPAAPNTNGEPEPVGSTHHDKGIEVEYRVTARDCDEIADHVSELVSADLRAKLDAKKQNDKQREAAERDAEAEAEKEREAWLKQCQTLVGEVQQRSRIDCAISAKSVKAVDDCLNQ
ncbi:MAG TPA: hypothetical protein VFB62_19695 [Polyangiaceae bacterium]|jgi:hypothetical protein|nr:hypothetical protein [Polyangiaceae bacterium]